MQIVKIILDTTCVENYPAFVSTHLEEFRYGNQDLYIIKGIQNVLTNATIVRKIDKEEESEKEK